MPDNNKTDSKSTDPKDANKNRAVAGWIIAASLLGVIILGLVARYLPDMKERMRFFTDTSLGWLVFIIVAVQTYFSTKQWDAMTDGLNIERDKIAPRLRIAEVRVVGLGVGRIPAFLVTLVNEGATDARDVSLHMQIENDSAVVKWDREQIVTVAANGKQDYFIKWWNESLTEQRLNGYDFVAPLKVSGFFQHADNARQSFCYKYYPWDGRPEGIPQFIPCDFDPNGIVEVPMTGGRIMTMTSDGKKSVSPKVEREPKTKKENNPS